MKALFLFEHSGYAAEPFTRVGWETIIVDLANTAPNPRATHALDWNILERERDLSEIAQECEFVFGMPPCTDLAVSGARHFNAKRDANPMYQVEAIHLFMATHRIAGAQPYAIENPIGVMSRLWRKPDWTFDPSEYGGYLPVGDTHPDFPTYIAPRDAYPKRTCLWIGNGFRVPPKRFVPREAGWSRQQNLLGGKSARTKLIRSASPRGFFIALAQRYSLANGGGGL